MRKPRKNYTAEEKVAILKRHLVEKTPVSDLCDELGLNPTVFYNWQKLFFENGAAALARTRKPKADRRDRKIELLEAKLTQKNEVLAELMQEHVQLKKELGEL
jgi:transposase-like protein